MKYQIKILLAVVVLLGVALYASSTDARKITEPSPRDGRVFNSLSDLTGLDGIEVETKNGETVGLVAIKKGGTKIALKEQSQPTSATSCPAGLKLKCWEDEGLMMSMCVCVSEGGGGGVIRKVGNGLKFNNIIIK